MSGGKRERSLLLLSYSSFVVYHTSLSSSTANKQSVLLTSPDVTHEGIYLAYIHLDHCNPHHANNTQTLAVAGVTKENVRYGFPHRVNVLGSRENIISDKKERNQKKRRKRERMNGRRKPK